MARQKRSHRDGSLAPPIDNVWRKVIRLHTCIVIFVNRAQRRAAQPQRPQPPTIIIAILRAPTG
ncbi:hypothetical protein VFPFJ_06592 [Purpureocillium lilacinum]|nr:hypothetical protein VFPFJ_06592 [Purpureocillium lilacinum]OAQ88127.1 hypothetical protein VFPFJ_06592 [Purpureocillium lilacinum]